MSEKEVKVVKVKLPRSVYKKVLEKIQRRGYLTISEFLRDVIRRELEEG